MAAFHKKKALNVYSGASHVGVFSSESDKFLAFRYHPDWLLNEGAYPISLSMPLSERVWNGECVSSYFDGLLPDDHRIREKIASRAQAESSGTFDLLSVIGRDCTGSLCFVPEGGEPVDPEEMSYRKVGLDEMTQRLASLDTSPLGLCPDEGDFRISIAGVQEKTAFLQINGEWHLPLGSTPTSHIFKPPIKDRPYGADLSDVSWNEWLCLVLCQTLGVESANAEVQMFDDMPVIVLERFDRVWRDRVLYRIPQEDICQSLSIPPMRKYQSDGGPSFSDVLGFLNGAVEPRKERIQFFKAQVVFWLLAAIDGHAKNFSVFLTPEGYRLTPVYDVMSADPYPEFSPENVKMVMAVGDGQHYRLDQILPEHFYQTGRKSGLSKDDMDEIFSQLAGRLDNAISKAGDLAAKSGMPSKTSEPILQGIKKRTQLIQ